MKGKLLLGNMPPARSDTVNDGAIMQKLREKKVRARVVFETLQKEILTVGVHIKLLMFSIQVSGGHEKRVQNYIKEAQKLFPELLWKEEESPLPYSTRKGARA
jgi:hypothetical protein